MNPLKVHGTDLSHHNPNPDLKRAKEAGLLWLYHKCTEGQTMRDATYTQRRNAARVACIPFGGYHFAHPDGNDAVAEARFFFTNLDPQAGDLVPVLDLEVSGSNLEAWSKTFMKELERLLKMRGLEGRPMHYGPNDFGPDYPYLRWVPRYNTDNRRPEIKWDIHQFSGGSGTPGTPSSFPGLGAVDLNNMRDGLSLSDFRLTKAGPPPKKKVNKVELEVIAANMGRPDDPRKMIESWNILAKEANTRKVDMVAVLEFMEGDKDFQPLNERELALKLFPKAKWDWYFEDTKNPIFVRKGVDVGGKFSEKFSQGLARQTPPRAMHGVAKRDFDPKTHEGPLIWLETLHWPAGAKNGDRPPEIKKELEIRWDQCKRGSTRRVEDVRDKGDVALRFMDTNSPGLNVKSIYGGASEKLFDDRPDRAFTTVAPGWKMRYKTQKIDLTIESMHDAHWIKVVFERN